MQPRKPGNAFDDYVQTQFGNYNDFEFEGAADIPIVEDKLLARIAGNRAQRDGFTKDALTGQATTSIPNGG